MGPWFLLSLHCLLLISSLLFTSSNPIPNVISVRQVPTPIAANWFRFDFVPLQNVNVSHFAIFSLFIFSEESSKTFPFIASTDARFPGLFVQSVSASASDSGLISCLMFNPDDVGRLSPTDAGYFTQGKEKDEWVFMLSAFIPANSIISCVVELLNNNRPALPLQVDSLDKSWSIKNPIAVPAGNLDRYADPHSFTKVAIHYRAGDVILAGERLDILEFVVEAVPSNVVLPLLIGFDSARESKIDKVFYLDLSASHYIANAWSVLKSGTHDRSLTPEDEGFNQQSFELPSPLCGHDVRIVFSRSKSQFFLITGDEPSPVVTCRIPLPIFYIHGLLARSPLRRQNLHLWTDMPIMTYLQLNGRLFKQNTSSNNPRWWFNDNPHIAQYSTLVKDSYLRKDDDTGSQMLVFDYQIIFIGPKPTIRFHKFSTHEQYTIQRFFTPAEDQGGFLKHFSFVTSPSDIKHSAMHKPLALNMTDPFSTTYSFDDVYNGYLAVLISFTVPVSDFSPFSLQVMSHEGKLSHLVQAPNWTVSSRITKISDTSTTTVTTLSTLHPRLSLLSGDVGLIEINPENYYMFHSSIELTHFPIIYEYRPERGFLPTNCTITFFNTTVDPPAQFEPPELPTIRFETVPLLQKDFAPDLNSYIYIENVQLGYNVQVRISCDNPADANVLKPPLIRAGSPVELTALTRDYAPLSISNYLLETPSSGTWTTPREKTQKEQTMAERPFYLVSPTPINSEADFENLLTIALQILKEAVYYRSSDDSGPSASLFKDCVTRDSFYQVLPGTDRVNEVSETYMAHSYYPSSISADGWDDSTDDLSIGAEPAWKNRFAIDTVSIYPNGAYLEFAIDAAKCLAGPITATELSSHTFYSKSGVLVGIIPYSWYALFPRYDTPQLHYQGKSDRKLRRGNPTATPAVGSDDVSQFSIGKNGEGRLDRDHTDHHDHHDDPTRFSLSALDSDDIDTLPFNIGRKGGGMRCRSHFDCAGSSPSIQYATYLTCYRGYCTTPVQSLTPFEFRLFNAWTSHRNAKHHISIDTSHDYSPLPTPSIVRKLLLWILTPLLAIGVVLLIYEVIRHFKLCSLCSFCLTSKKRSSQLDDRLIDSDEEFSDDPQSVGLSGSLTV